MYPSNQVQIFNRWGELLFQSQTGNYQSKPWDGTFNGDKLPVGSYYYIVSKNPTDNEKWNGTVSILED